MLQKAFDDLTMLQKNVYKWYKDIKEGKECVDDLEAPDDHQHQLMSNMSIKSKN